MPVLDADVAWRYSKSTATAGNTETATAAQSLGRNISQTVIAAATINSLFPNITSLENAGGAVKYRCIFLHNSHATLALRVIKVWLEAEVAGGANVAIAIDDLPASPLGDTADQADVIATETTAPGTGVGAFSSPTTSGGGLNLGDLLAGQCRAVWVRQTAVGSGSIAGDGFTIRAEGASD